jgi:hypothetical protein
MSMLGVNGAKSASDQVRWGTGITHADYGNLKYVGLQRGEQTLVAGRDDATAPSDDVRFGFRANVSAAQRGGMYRGVVQVTAFTAP